MKAENLSVGRALPCAPLQTGIGVASLPGFLLPE